MLVILLCSQLLLACPTTGFQPARPVLAARPQHSRSALSMCGEGPDANRFSLGFLEALGKRDLKIGDQIIAGNDWNSSSPAYGIVRAQTYELQRVYFQGVRDGKVERMEVESLGAVAPVGCEGFTKYLVLFSQRYHAETGPVVLKPNEVQIVSVRDEITDSAWLALPGLFWVWLAYTFYQYGVSTGRM